MYVCVGVCVCVCVYCVCVYNMCPPGAARWVVYIHMGDRRGLIH